MLIKQNIAFLRARAEVRSNETPDLLPSSSTPRPIFYASFGTLLNQLVRLE
jgi:hypothetical protein